MKSDLGCQQKAQRGPQKLLNWLSGSPSTTICSQLLSCDEVSLMKSSPHNNRGLSYLENKICVFSLLLYSYWVPKCGKKCLFPGMTCFMTSFPVSWCHCWPSKGFTNAILPTEWNEFDSPTLTALLEGIVCFETFIEFLGGFGFFDNSSGKQVTILWAQT